MESSGNSQEDCQERQESIRELDGPDKENIQAQPGKDKPQAQKKGEVIEIFDNDNSKLMSKRGFMEFNAKLDDVEKIKHLIKLLQENEDNYYYFFKLKQRDWLRFIDNIHHEDDNVAIKINFLFKLLRIAQHSLEYSLQNVRRLKDPPLIFTRQEIGQILNDQQLVRCFLQICSDQDSLIVHMDAILNCMSLLVTIADNFHVKIKTLLSYRLQDRQTNVFEKIFQTLSAFSIQDLQQANDIHIIQTFDLFMSFDQDKYSRFIDYKQLIMNLLIISKKDYTEKQKRIKVGPIIVLIKILKDLSQDIHNLEEEEFHPNFAEELLNTGILAYIYDIFSFIQNNGKALISRYSYEVLVYQIFSITMNVNDKALRDEELFKVLYNLDMYLLLLKRCLFDYNSNLFHHEVCRMQSKNLMSELARRAIIDQDLLKRLKDEGFIDLLALMIAESGYYSGKQQLRDALQNLYKAESIHAILEEQVYAACA